MTTVIVPARLAANPVYFPCYCFYKRIGRSAGNTDINARKFAGKASERGRQDRLGNARQLADSTEVQLVQLIEVHYS